MKKSIKILNFLLVLVCIMGSIYSINHIYKQKQDEKNWEQLQQSISETNEEEIKNPEYEQYIEEEEEQQDIIESEEQQVLEQYKELYMQNQDMVGWIRIDDTVINYPVMQTSIDDPNYYIDKSFEKEKNKSGVPFIDARCSFDSENIIIYAHNMKNGTMFGSLTKYKEESYYQQHKVITFDTIYEKAEYEIIAVFLSKVYYDEQPPEDAFIFYNYIELDTEDVFEEYVSNIKSNSLYNVEANAKYGDMLITLCTCNYHTKDGRLLVVARKL